MDRVSKKTHHTSLYDGFFNEESNLFLSGYDAYPGRCIILFYNI